MAGKIFLRVYFSIIVKNNGLTDTDIALVFSFVNFKFFPVNIDGVFNNFYESDKEYIRKISILLGKALPLLSHENHSLFNDVAKRSSLHLHKLSGKEDILRRIFRGNAIMHDVPIVMK